MRLCVGNDSHPRGVGWDLDTRLGVEAWVRNLGPNPAEVCQHYDGDGWNGATLEDAVERARRFQGRAVFHTDTPKNAVRPVTDIMNVPTTFVRSGLGAHAIACPG